MLSSLSTEALIALEDDSPDVLFEKVRGTDLSIWPLMRVPLGRWSADAELGTRIIAKRASRLNAVSRLLARHFSPRPYSPDLIRRQHDVLFIAGGGTYTQTDNGRHNWLIDGFAESLGGNAMVLQDRAINFHSAIERPIFHETYSFHDVRPSIDLKARFSPISRSTMDSVQRVVNEIISRYQFPVAEATRHRVLANVISGIRRAPHIEHEHRKILDRVSPTLVVMDGASYGNRAVVSSLLRECGVPVVEPQHGWIGPSHGAYNFGRAMTDPSLRRYLPDRLMTFGEFWSDQIRHPASIIPIGKPYLEQVIASHRGQNKEPIVLIASSTYRPEQLVALAVALRDQMPPPWRILLRPHPSERAKAAESFPTLSHEDRIELDMSADVYNSLSTSSAVIGHASTVLYEALAFRIPVLVIDSPLADLYAPTEVFGSRVAVGTTPTHEIATRILSEHDRSVSSDLLARIWKPNALESFQKLVNEVITAKR